MIRSTLFGRLFRIVNESMARSALDVMKAFFDE
jgi:hypothetical protein